MQWLNDQIVKTMPAPASSPDLNPIENVWATLKDYLKRQVKPRTKAQLVHGITANNLTAEDCAKYIDHIHRILPHVVLNDGGPSGFL
ncbi:hypothetical protein DPMN_027558 [Dreissena polymorpha]|uniref:Tc1-like transposase DDE domain-containing protein n=1 Tax=Dreissena polymorpha TaxID=45954 RepID=A0A9D4REH4_DREPO|nr:hypothetical protein DPMN_027558 [Dreissena polymorpha]